MLFCVLLLWRHILPDEPCASRGAPPPQEIGLTSCSGATDGGRHSRRTLPCLCTASKITCGSTSIVRSTNTTSAPSGSTAIRRYSLCPSCLSYMLGSYRPVISALSDRFLHGAKIRR